MIPTAGTPWPTGCVGNCQQGHGACTAPMHCSGATQEADEAIARFRTAPRAPVIHRQPLPRTFVPDYGIEPPSKSEGVITALLRWRNGFLVIAAGCAAMAAISYFVKGPL